MQISLQADEQSLSDRIAGTPSYERKISAARTVKEMDWPLTMNAVVHRHNIDRTGRILDLAEELGADRIELANTQYYGWARRNRASLLPTRAQLDRAEQVVRDARRRLKGEMEIIYVIPDYYSKFPKPCMGGWGKNQLTVTPNGNVLPRGAHHRSSQNHRARELADLDMVGVAPLPAFPGNGVDARTLPELRPPRGRFRRLPLPGVPAHR